MSKRLQQSLKSAEEDSKEDLEDENQEMVAEIKRTQNEIEELNKQISTKTHRFGGSDYYTFSLEKKIIFEELS